MFDTVGTEEQPKQTFMSRFYNYVDRDMFYNIELHWPGPGAEAGKEHDNGT